MNGLNMLLSCFRATMSVPGRRLQDADAVDEAKLLRGGALVEPLEEINALSHECALRARDGDGGDGLRVHEQRLDHGCEAQVLALKMGLKMALKVAIKMAIKMALKIALKVTLKMALKWL